MLIYLITNTINNKVYVGQTVRAMKDRWYGHKSDAKTRKNNMVISRAIQKHGKENFKIEMIACATNMTELNYLEWIHIHKYNSLHPNGYNMIEGGGSRKPSKETREKLSIARKKYYRTHSGTGCKQVIDVVTGEWWESATSCAKDRDMNKGTLTDKLSGITGNETDLRYLGKEDVCKPVGIGAPKVVVDIVTGQRWKSASECAKDCNLNMKFLAARLSGSNGNDTNLRYLGMEDVCKPLKNIKRQVVNIVTKETWKSTTAAALANNINYNTLTGKLSGKRKNTTNLRYVTNND